MKKKPEMKRPVRRFVDLDTASPKDATGRVRLIMDLTKPIPFNETAAWKKCAIQLYYEMMNSMDRINTRYTCTYTAMFHILSLAAEMARKQMECDIRLTTGKDENEVAGYAEELTDVAGVNAAKFLSMIMDSLGEAGVVG